MDRKVVFSGGKRAKEKVRVVKRPVGLQYYKGNYRKEQRVAKRWGEGREKEKS